MPVTLFSNLLTDKSPVPMLGEIGSTEALCALCEHDVTNMKSRILLRWLTDSFHSFILWSLNGFIQSLLVPRSPRYVQYMYA